MFTDFTIEDSDGKTVSFSEYIGKGKYVLVDFWADGADPQTRDPHIRRYTTNTTGTSSPYWGSRMEEPEDTKKALKIWVLYGLQS